MADVIPFLPQEEDTLQKEIRVALFREGYTVIQKIDEGGFGELYEVQDKAGHSHSLKLLTIPKKEHPNVAAAYGAAHTLGILEREIIAKNFRHGNIWQFHTTGNVILGGKEVGFVVGELIRGKNLEKIVEQEKLSFPERERIIKEIVSAVAYLHAYDSGFVHNDIKLDNVMLDTERNNRAVLIDFSNAEQTDENGLVLNPAPAFPSQRYRAPEIDVDRIVSMRSDVWALGIVLSQILTGRNPKEEGMPIKEFLRTQIPRRYRTLIRTCLKINPEMRYTNAEILLQELKKAEQYYLRQIGIPVGLMIAATALCGVVANIDVLQERMGNYYLNKCQEAGEEQPLTAEHYCQKAILWDAENPLIFLELGHTFVAQGKYEEARGAYRQAQKLVGAPDPKSQKPDIAEHLVGKAYILQKEGKKQQAAVLLYVAAELNK